MKSLHKWALGIVIASSAALPALAQDDSSSDLITLDDARPSVSASIALPANTTGVVRLDLSMASVVVTDEQGNTVFREADPRVRALELSLAPNTGTHTVTVERLPAHRQALARISSQVELTDTGPVDPATTNVLTLDQGYSLPLTSSVPSSNVRLDVRVNSSAVVTASYPTSGATAQLVDNAGQIIATAGVNIDGLGIVLDSGIYDFTLRSSPIAADMTVDVHMRAADAVSYALLTAPVDSPITVSDTTSAPAAAEPCTATVTVAAANMRSGPGAGYSVLGLGLAGLNVEVGGTNPDQSWLVVGTPDGASAWVARDLVELSGVCNDLTVFNVPSLDSQTVQIVPNNGFRGDDDHDEVGEFGEHEFEHDD